MMRNLNVNCFVLLLFMGNDIICINIMVNGANEKKKDGVKFVNIWRLTTTLVNPFNATGFLQYPLKTENQRFMRFGWKQSTYV